MAMTRSRNQTQYLGLGSMKRQQEQAQPEEEDHAHHAKRAKAARTPAPSVTAPQTPATSINTIEAPAAPAGRPRARTKAAATAGPGPTGPAGPNQDSFTSSTKSGRSSVQQKPAQRESDDWVLHLKAGWNMCNCASDLALGSDGGGEIFKPPKSADNAKWSAAVKQVSAQLELVQSLLINGQPKDQELKSAATALRKAANGKAKKAGTKANPTMLGDRFKGLADIITQLKAFRATVTGARVGNLCPSNIQKALEELASQWHALATTGTDTDKMFLTYPDSWVRTWVSTALS